MLVLSIDIGMKHLAHCLLQTDALHLLDWDVVDLTETPPCDRCVKSAAFRCAHGAYCKKHVPVVPPLQGLLKNDLDALCATHGLPRGTRPEMASSLAAFKKRERIKSRTTVELGRALAAAYARFPTVDVVLVENQMAARMAVVQGMVVQYWIMRGARTIEIVSPTHKLRGLVSGKTTYAERKKLSVAHTRTALATLGLPPAAFEAHAKKDDLADTLLQALWWLKRGV